MTRRMTIEAFLDDLSRQEIRVWNDGGRLRCQGPEGTLTQDIAETIRSLKADILSHLETEAGDGQTIIARHDPFPPLSFAQQRLWFIEQMMPGSGLHHMAFAFDAVGQLDLAALDAALGKVVRRHTILRTRIGTQEGGPVQQVMEDVALPLHIIDRRDDAHGESERDRLLLTEARRPFDLAGEPPLRLTVLRLSDDRAVIMLTLHHIAADGWSMEVLLREIAGHYQNAIAGAADDRPALPIQYGDFAAWQCDYLAGPALEKTLAFWQAHLQAPSPVTRLPGDFARPPIQANQGALHAVALDGETVARLRLLSGEVGATVFATLFAAFNILIYRYTGQPDLVIGTPVANRRHRETEDLIGLFVNPLPVRSTLNPAESFRETLVRMQATLWQVLEHQDLPFERLVEALNPERDPSAHPLFQLKFQLDAAPKESIGLPGLQLTRLARRDGVAKLDLSLNLQEADDGIRGTFEFDTALFKPETIASLARHFRALVQGIAANPDQAIAALPLLDDEDRERQIVAWNDTEKPYDTAAFFHTLFEAHAARTPNAVALVHVAGGVVSTQTYGVLNRRANQIAHMLRGRGVGPESVVAIALDRDFDMIAAWLGVMKAGGAYLPLDPAYPADRLASMLEDSDAAVVLTASTMVLPEGINRVDLDAQWPLEASADNPVLVSRPDHLAYVIYTSGSTGRPKGVLIEHRGLVNLTMDKIRICDVRPGDCVLQFFSFSFDASIPELVMGLGAGAKLLLLPSMDALPGPLLADRMRMEGVTHVTMTPSALLALPVGDYPALRMVLTGGEAPTPDLIERWGTGRVFINAYGPTETTVNASMVPCGNGHPVEATLLPSANKQLYVLDAHLESLPVGTPGELHIGGLGIARGYHGRPALTAERFVPDPFAGKGTSGVLYRTGDRACQLADGRIRVLGRLDDQVKIRGYRIEPGEIEAMVLTHPDIAAATVAIREAGGQKRVIAYGVSKSANPESPAALRAWLAERLPRFLVPDAFLWIDRLPLTVNSKIDMRALPLPDFAQDGNGRMPQGATEEAIAAAFGAVLGKGPIFATDDFFAIGGHSLLATRLSAIAKERFGLDITILDIFNAPTVEALALRIANGDCRTHSDAADLDKDIRLDPAIRPARFAAAAHPPRHVLLTGATGFVGAYLLRDLLRDEGRRVTCLVRGTDGVERLQRALSTYGLWQDSLAGRLHAVAGDLSMPRLGLSSSDESALAESVDAILHNGAEVHHLHPYERLRTSNVAGTTEVIRLAAAGRGCPLHLVSSLSALSRRGSGAPILESDPITAFPPPSGGYNRTKWVAEHLAEDARARGLPVTIHRPGAISGDSRTGAFNGADILCRLMQGYMRSRLAPEGDTALEMLPVDYVSRAIVTLVDMPEAVGKTFHHVHSTPVTSALLFEAAALEGLTLARISRPAWRALLERIARDDTSHPLYPLMGLFEEAPGETSAQPAGMRSFDRACARTALADAPFAEPPLDIALFRRYLRAFIRAGALHPSTVDERTYA